jgi:hypothetical protein
VSTQAPTQLCDEAIRLLGAALDKPPAELKAEVDLAQQAIVAVRDALIDRLRKGPTEQVRSNLEQVNLALSLVVGVEYSMGGLNRDLLKQARSVLQAERRKWFV